MERYLSLGFFLLLVVAASAYGGTFEAGAWYQVLNKPEWTPPPWLFGPVWAVLYVLIAVAAWQVWLSGRSIRVGALTWWLLVLLMNVAWSWLMFELHRPGWAFMLLVLIVAVAIMCARAFFLVKRQAGTLMIPLVLWLAFATYLNYAIWTMNAGGFGNLLGG